MKNKNLSLLVLLSVMIVVMAGLVSAGTCTFNTPGASATISGAAYRFNITSTSNLTANCSITGTSALSGGSWAVGTAWNSTSGNLNQSNVTVSSLAQRDAADWVFTATCYNLSGISDTCSRSGVIINNTVPTVSGCTVNGATAASGAVGSSDITFACSVRNATSCSVYWKTSTALTFSTTAQSRSDASTAALTTTSSYTTAQTATAYLKSAEDDAKNAYISCTDGTDTTTGTTYALSVDGYSPAQEQIKRYGIPGTDAYGDYVQKKNKQIVLFILIGVAALFIIIATFAISRKK